MFKVIIWATDGSSGAAQALPYAKGLAQANAARLIVVHVNEFVASRAAGPVNVKEDEVQAAIGKQVEKLKQEGLDATLQLGEVMAGGAAHVIADIAKERGADLIVAGTRGLGPVSRLLIGSVTHRLVQIAPCPVLVIPPAGASTS
jgi:nucleotide-binding universal stress UspA family protein